MNRAKEVLTLFLQFMKFGCFTFGGGWSIVAQMQKQYVEKEKNITAEELLDLTSVGRSMPGVMIGNVAMLYGYRRRGYLGGLACVIGMAIPPLVVLACVTYFYTIFRDNTWVMAAMNGVRAAVVPIMLSAAYSMVKGALRNIPCVVVCLISFALYAFLDVSCIWLVLIGAACGLAISEYYERKGAKQS